jgi:DNA-binding winged helix-turn-helix (wHTH) protein
MNRGVLLPFDDFVLDTEPCELRKGNTVVKADPQQLALLRFLLEHPNELLSKQRILDAVWDGRAVADNVLSVAVAKLRKVLGPRSDNREFIENSYGRGYRFVPGVAPLTVEATSLEVHPSAIVENPQITVEHAPLVGRQESLRQLTEALLRAQLGKGSLYVLSGEAGIGKTRLAEALEAIAREQSIVTAWGRCQSGAGTPPLWLFQQILRELNGGGVADDGLSLRARESSRDATAGAIEEESRRLVATISSGRSVDHRTIDDLSQLLFRASRQAPMLLLIDDLHWADAASLRALTYLVDDIARCPLLVLATMRAVEPAEDREPELSRLWCHRHCQRTELGRLRAGDVEEYVRMALGSSLPDLSRVVFARSEGNPFFMIELLRGLDRRQLNHAQPQLSGLTLDVVRKRLRGLPEESQRVLSAAAIIGHDFDIGLLAHVSECSADEVIDALDDSLANDTVVPSNEIVGGYAFDHELIRELLAADLSIGERKRLHLRAGEGLLRRRAGGDAIPSAELAHHFLSALPHGDVARAIEHAEASAALASRMASHADARMLLQRALDALSFWIEPKPETKNGLLIQLAIVERVLGDPAYVEHLQLAVSLARQHRFGRLLMVAGQMLSPAPGLLARSDASSVLTAAAEVLEPDDHRSRAIVLAHLAWTPPSSHSARRVTPLLAEAEALAIKSQDPEAIATVRDAQLFFSGGPDTQERAEVIAREIERDLIAHPDTAPQSRKVSVANFRLISAMQRGDADAVARAIEARASTLAKLDNVELAWHHERLLVVERMNHGDFSRVEEDLVRLRGQAKRFRLQAFRTLWALDYGTLLWRTGNVQAFAARVRPGLALVASDSPAIRARKIRSLVDYGFIEDVVAALREIPVDALHDLPRDRDHLTVLAQLALGSAAARSFEHCRALYALLLPYAHSYAVGISFHCGGSVARYLGALARALGDDRQARAHLELALARDSEFGLEPCAAETRFALAELHLSSASEYDCALGLRLLEQTQQAAQQMGMQPLAAFAQRARDDVTTGRAPRSST